MHPRPITMPVNCTISTWNTAVIHFTPHRKIFTLHTGWGAVVEDVVVQNFYSAGARGGAVYVRAFQNASVRYVVITDTLALGPGSAILTVAGTQHGKPQCVMAYVTIRGAHTFSSTSEILPSL
eukprot:NODE_1201_length_1837_cov_79.559510_g1139_i0.p1 GENE.NODE_1201_length_1837_cov_79.559510_g1139_i0~~NODE_1201_length_1837_cov_79.559510_g1139_i0.p1  ORF type:complete len:123 (+),score=2.65 NODE_1201_length_1837_cov_79.559510_g1139_i0:697-1065(+)